MALRYLEPELPRTLETPQAQQRLIRDGVAPPTDVNPETLSNPNTLTHPKPELPRALGTPQAQQHLIRDGVASLTEHLYSWLVAKGGRGEGGAGAEAGPLPGDEGDPSSGGAGGGGGAAPSGHGRMAAFAAHMLLALEGLGVLGSAVDDLYELTRWVWKSCA